MNVIPTELAGVVIIEPSVSSDDRGFFLESYSRRRYADLAGISAEFLQDNHSRSRKNVLRGLHLQVHFPQGKLVRVVRGEVWDVAVDVDPNSPTFKQWVGVNLSEENHRQFYIPPGYAHGFCVVSEVADFEYKCTDYYHPEDQIGIAWDDPTIGIDWPISQPILSERDRTNARLEQWLGKGS